MKNKFKLNRLQDQKVYIDDDMTVMQRNVQKEIRAIAEKERARGKVVKVGYRKLIVNGEKLIWSKRDMALKTANQVQVAARRLKN